jgi:hypothetical protein
MEKELQKEVTDVARGEEKAGIQKIQAPPGFRNILSNPPTVLDVLGKIVCHPFVTLGGVVVIIYVVYKAWRSGFFDLRKATLSGADTDLMLEIKALRKENKKLKQELTLLVDKDRCHIGNERNLLAAGKKKVSTAYLD